MSKTDEPCVTLLIEDEPAIEDAFSSDGELGPHARVASAIEDTIYSSDGGKVIGLEGGWGSGKSTVVRLVTKRLEKDPHIVTISFDAWAHEGDPLRRTYIETIASKFQQLRWVDTTKWENELASLSKRTKQTLTRTTRSPTTLGVLLALALLLIPIGSTMVGDALRDYSISFSGGEPAWQFIIGSALSLSPLLVAAGRLIYLTFSGTAKKIADPSSWAFLSGTYDEDATTNSSETPNPTSLEFERLFYDLMSEALSDSKRRVLLVIDNLDRTDATEALKIWSTMQTFLHATRNREQEWFKRIWVLVPFDREGLRRLWGRDRDTREPQRVNLDLVPNIVQYDSSQDVTTDSFFEKSFQVRFTVPPLILSGWHSLLVRLLDVALPKHKDDQRKIYRTLDHFRADRSAAPTPRQLKAFVNQIGAVHRQWAHTYPLDHAAYFVLQSSNAKDLIVKLRSGKIPTDDAIRMLGPDLRRNLAGLAFNVTADKGIELLLSGIVFDALIGAKTNDDSLSSLASRHGDGFWKILDQVAFERLIEIAPSTLARVFRSLESSNLLENARTEAVSVKKALVNAADSAQLWTPFDEEMGAAIAAVVRLARDPEFSGRMITSIRSTFATYLPETGGPNGSGKKLTHAVIAVFNALAAIKHEEVIPSELVLPISASEWEPACEQLAALDPEMRFWRIFRPSSGFDAVVQFVVAAIGNGAFGELTKLTIEVTRHIQPEISWEQTLPAFRGRLDASQNVGSKEARWLFDAYRRINKVNKAQLRPYNELFDNGHILHHFHRATKEGDHESRALLAFLQLGKFPNNQPVNQSGNSQAGHQLLETTLGSTDKEMVDNFLALLERESKTSLLFAILDARGKVDPLVIACLRAATGRPRPHEVFTSEVVRSRWAFLRANLDAAPDNAHFARMLRESLDSTALATDVQDGGFSRTSVPMYLEMIGVEGSPSGAALATWCAKSLTVLATEQWVADFGESFVLAELTLLLVSRGVTPDLSLAFVDAIERHAASVCLDQQVPKGNLAARWGTLIACIGDESLRSNLRSKLLRVAADNSGGRLQDSFFDMYGTYVVEGIKQMSNFEPLFRLLLGVVKQRGPQRGLTWGAQVLDSNPAMRNHESALDLSRELEIRLRQAIDDGASPEIEAIARSIGVAPKSPANGVE